MAEPIKLDDLTIFNAMSTRDIFVKALSEDQAEFDLSDVGEIDSSGLQLLIALRKQADIDGKNVKYHSVSDPVRELIDQYGMADVIGLSA
ncbi:MAG: STAS domain-containing protein [Gammaproteobacteria bacterium]|nr:STAS domain-containing protein [Gammaproteobacteria bacterium]